MFVRTKTHDARTADREIMMHHELATMMPSITNATLAVLSLLRSPGALNTTGILDHPAVSKIC